MPEHTIIKPVIADKFNKFIKNGRIFFLSAPCGFGKTVLADALLQGKKILRLNADTADFSSVSAKKNGIFYLLMICSLCRMSLTDSFCANLYVQSRNVVLYCFHEEYRQDI